MHGPLNVNFVRFSTASRYSLPQCPNWLGGAPRIQKVPDALSSKVKQPDREAEFSCNLMPRLRMTAAKPPRSCLYIGLFYDTVTLSVVI